MQERGISCKVTQFLKSIFFSLSFVFSKFFTSLSYITLFSLFLTILFKINFEIFLDYTLYPNWGCCIVQVLGSELSFIGIEVRTSLLSKAKSQHRAPIREQYLANTCTINPLPLLTQHIQRVLKTVLLFDFKHNFHSNCFRNKIVNKLNPKT